MNPLRFIHVTDTHVTDPGGLVYGVDPLQVLCNCIARINQDSFGGEMCIVTGDLVHYGTEVRYAALKGALAEFKMPYHLLIGNSDDRILFHECFPDQPWDENGFVQAVLDRDNVRLIFLDTVGEADDVTGLLCARRLAWLEAKLREASGMQVLVFMHHPPFEMYSAHQNEMGLRGKAEFLHLIEAHGNVRHIFFGHTHRPISGLWKKTSFSSMRGTQMECSLRQDSADPDLFSCSSGIYACVVVDADQVIINDVDTLIEHDQPFPRT